VNAANPAGGNALSPRSIASLYGANLAAEIAVADLAPPLPFTLGGVTMTIANNAVPLFFVSPSQVNFQVPFVTVTGQTNVSLTLAQGASSTTVTVPLRPFAPALFTTNAQGTGQASALIAGTASVAAPTGTFPDSRPAKIGEFVSIYATGLGDVTNRPALGAASPGNPHPGHAGGDDWRRAGDCFLFRAGSRLCRPIPDQRTGSRRHTNRAWYSDCVDGWRGYFEYCGHCGGSGAVDHNRRKQHRESS
jgi:uncharacterized protein (TIGR03437 family)